MKLSQFDKTMVAMAFGEAGEPDTAREFLGEPAGPRKAHCPAVKKKPLGAMLFFGAVSLAFYVALISQQDLVMNIFTMGGWHAVFPVGAAFLFSFVHGAFASNLLAVLGLEAHK